MTTNRSTSARRQRTILEKSLPSLPAERTRHRRSIQDVIRRVSLNLWLWELLGLLTSTSCVLAILIILGRYNGKPVPTWSYGLTINGVVSLLAVVAKAALIVPIAEAISQLKWCWYRDRNRPVVDFERFDSASRGPWGSLVLLCHPHSWNLASLGALLTLAAIAIEPSLQQIPTYPLVQVSYGTAYTPRSTFYNEVERDATGAVLVNSRIIGAVYSAVFNTVPGNTNGLNPVCSTGNCTWSSFESLGVCNICQNTTNRLQKTFSDSTNSTSFALDNLHSLIVSAQATGWMNGGVYKSQAFNQTWADQSIVSLSYIYISPLDQEAAKTNKPQANALECVLYTCVKTYTAQMLNGDYQETITKTWPEPNSTMVENANVGSVFPCIGSYPHRAPDEDDPCAYPTKGNFTLSPTGSTERFAVDLGIYNPFRAWLGYRLELSYATRFNKYGNGEDPVFNDVPQAFYSTQFKSTAALRSNKTNVWDMFGPDVVMDRIALSLTNYMRSVGGSTDSAKGTASTVQNVVRARWWWLTFAITLLSLTAVFFLSTVALTIKKKAPIWKSSSLACLLHGLDDSSCKAMTASRFDHVEENAKAFNMAMKLDDDRWKLEGVDGRHGSD